MMNDGLRDYFLSLETPNVQKLIWLLECKKSTLHNDNSDSRKSFDEKVKNQINVLENNNCSWDYIMNKAATYELDMELI
jgi:hypothetical protein